MQQPVYAQPAQPVYTQPAQPAEPVQTPAAPVGQPPVLIWDPALGQYVPQQGGAVAEAPIQTAKPIVKPTAQTGKPQKTYVQTLLDSFAKSATTSAARESGRTLMRNLLGVFGLKHTGRR